jgi:AraC family transcriptional regulator
MTATVAPGGLLSTGTYFGRVVSTARVPGFALTETVYGREENLPRHAHERAFFCLTVQGSYSERTLRTGETAYAPWTAVFHPAGETHLTRMGAQGGRVLNVEVDPDRLDELRGLAPAPAASADLLGGELVWLLARLRRAARGRDAATGLDGEALGVELLASVARASRRDARPPRWLVRVAERLADDGPEPSVRDLAREAGVHPVHVARAFRRFHGVPPGTFRRRLRLRRACALLGKGASIADAAAQAGFADQSHLARALRSVLGETPSAFRRALAGVET